MRPEVHDDRLRCDSVWNPRQRAVGRVGGGIVYGPNPCRGCHRGRGLRILQLCPRVDSSKGRCSSSTPFGDRSKHRLRNLTLLLCASGTFLNLSNIGFGDLLIRRDGFFLYHEGEWRSDLFIRPARTCSRHRPPSHPAGPPDRAGGTPLWIRARRGPSGASVSSSQAGHTPRGSGPRPESEATRAA